MDRLPDKLCYDKLSTFGLLACGHWRKRQTEAAERTALAALRLSAHSDPRFLSVKPYHCTAEVLLRLWEDARANQAPTAEALAVSAREACAVLADYANVFTIGQPGYLLWWGVYRWLSGQRRAGLADLRRAASVASRLGMKYEEGAAHAELGRRLSGPAGGQHLENAVGLFEGIGAAYDAAEARAALASHAEYSPPRPRGSGLGSTEWQH